MNVPPFEDVAAVIVHYENWPEVRHTIEDALRGGVPESSIWLIDNSSNQNLADAVPGLYPSLQLINDHGNVGYAAGVNMGARAAEGAGYRYLFVLTHEVRFPPVTPSALRSALEASSHTSAVAPRLRSLDDPDIAWSEGGDLSRVRCLPVNRSSWKGSVVDWVDGSIFMIPLTTYWSLGGMHEPYFLYMEEVDFFARLRARGGEVRVLKDVFAQQSPGDMPFYLAVRNRIILARRVASRAHYAVVVVECVLRIAFASLFQRSQTEKNRARKKALRDALSSTG